MSQRSHLVLIAHGSRRSASNEEVQRFAERVGQVVMDRGGYDAVSCAFLELAEPSIPEAIDQAVAGGAGHVDLFPYFLAAGRHVAEDIPEIVSQRRTVHPGVGLRVLEHLGAWGALPEMVAAGLREGIPESPAGHG